MLEVPIHVHTGINLEEARNIPQQVRRATLDELLLQFIETRIGRGLFRGVLPASVGLRTLAPSRVPDCGDSTCDKLTNDGAL